MHKQKDVLTTGQVARICRVAPRTVSKWFDAGQLQGYRIPGSKDRRIPVQHLIRFMKAYGMPLDGLEAGKTGLLIVDREADESQPLHDSLTNDGAFDVHYAASAFEAGLAVESAKPAVMIVDVTMPDVDPEQIVRDLRMSQEAHGLKLIAVSAEMSEGAGQSLLQTGFDAYLRKPLDAAGTIDAVDRVLNGTR